MISSSPGSLIRGLPAEYTRSPVFTYGQADIVQSGAGAVSEYMLTIPQNFTGDLSDFGTSAAQIGTTLGGGTTYNQYDGFASFALRGLGLGRDPDVSERPAHGLGRDDQSRRPSPSCRPH